MSEAGTNPALDVNHQVARKLRDCASLLHQQGANPFRVSAYRKAADTVDRLDRPLADFISASDSTGLRNLPHIGEGIAAAIIEMLRTGRWARLERLRGTLDPVRLFRTIPGLGEILAERIHESLEIDSLEELELAAHDGRLEKVEGIGKRRALAVRSALYSMLGRVRRTPRYHGQGPAVEALLDVDREYRERASSGTLLKIAPRRFNPRRVSWLPILHTEKQDWHFTALFSNTVNAHRLGRTGDWVVIYFYDHDHEEGQCTVVTETRGPLIGRRVVRGRELECRQYYSRHQDEGQGSPTLKFH